jgi:hypothetical protein
MVLLAAGMAGLKVINWIYAPCWRAKKPWMVLATLNGRWESLAKNKPTMHMMLERQLAAVGDFQPKALLKSRFKLQDGQQLWYKKKFIAICSQNSLSYLTSTRNVKHLYGQNAVQFKFKYFFVF